MVKKNKDKDFMCEALNLAQQAGEMGEVPVGAVVVKNNIIIGRGYNRPITTSDPTSHAEIIALREAALYLCNYRLLNCTMYVTLEPCIMCIGAIFHARIARLIYGSRDFKTGACGSVVDIAANKQLNHHTHITGTLLEDKSSYLLKEFFIAKRRAN
ncbi:MAG: tRNA adenosine(34) deaminase TadA [Nitrosomonadaceae bacterium]|nr:tRNA adenosine(34) deaminase TadA [Nitrosomonadaceae bacterium]|tara:strand:+ start:148 stop:615 length:468 start_codon:yes stop_codon:yes gene_type:complete